MEIGAQSRLVQMCIESACESKETVEKWRRQRRTLERMPSPLADALLRQLLRRRLLFPSLLEAFKYSVEMIDLGGANTVDEEWMAYLGSFRCLSYLNLADCHRITNSALWSLSGMTCLREMDLSRCAKVTDAGIKHLLSISTLEKLHISETGLTAGGVALLSSLEHLSVLDLGGLPVTDVALSSLQVLTKLQYLDLWGSKISDKGASMLQMFPNLSFLNLAWTSVTQVPNLPSIESLNLSNCTIDSILEGDGDKAPLAKLFLSGSTFINEADAFLYVETSFLSSLDLSNSSLQRYSFLSHMKCLRHLDLNSSTMGDDLLDLVACIGENLRSLNLSKTKVSSAGVGILAGHVPNLEIISISHTLIDDVAISYVSMMPSLKVIDLSHTNIKGFVHRGGAEPDSSLLALQSLKHLECLNLEQTQVRDSALCFLSSFQELSRLYLKSFSLTDASLYHVSSLSKLTNLGIRDAVLTDCGLDSFKPPGTLRILDLRGCWLLTENGLLSFHKTNPLIDIRHEVQLSPSNQNPSPSRMPMRSYQVKQNRRKLPVSEFFVDQTLNIVERSCFCFGIPHYL